MAPFFMVKPFKIPQSVLVVIYTDDLDVLLIRRADGWDGARAFWQSVTGSKETSNETWSETACREVWEETGIDCRPGGPYSGDLNDWFLENVYGIYPQWLHRYPKGVTHNQERIFGLNVHQRVAIVLNPVEHVAYQWLPHLDAADACFSPSNAEAILRLPSMVLPSDSLRSMLR